MTLPHDFSGNAVNYKAFRPPYPAPLFVSLASLAPAQELAWDCATGNGQSAVALARHFQSVIATDASPEQIAEAYPHAKVTYIVAPAEHTPIIDESVDMITVSLALHWFDLDAFYAEVRRVARPGGVLACWTYHLQRVTPEVDAVVRRLYTDILGPYWSPQIRKVEVGYRSLPFPFEEITMPRFRISEQWNLGQLMSCIRTWSGSEEYRKQIGRDAIDEIRDELTSAWGDPGRVREVVWDLDLRVGRVGEP